MQDLCKDYWLLEHPGDAIKAFLGKKPRLFRALDRVSFSVAPGEVLGVIGRNGAGKSTLLKVLYGVSNPTSGQVTLRGRCNAILETTTGFQHDATGRQNVHNSLALRGFSPSETRRFAPEIIEFSELDNAIDHRVQTYSSGMAARLAFAIATYAPAEILLLDELLVVGDEHFQAKSFKRIQDICASGCTIVMVSHATNYVERLCDRCVLLEKGRVLALGDAHDVVMQYYASSSGPAGVHYPREYGEIRSARVITRRSVLEILVVIDRRKRAEDMQLQVAVHDNRHGILSAMMNTASNGVRIPAGLGQIQISARIPRFAGLRNGLIGVALFKGMGIRNDRQIDDALGWDSGEQVYFSAPPADEFTTGYLGWKLEWQRCS